MQQRIQAYKDQDWPRYGDLINKAAQGMMKLQAEMTGKACQHLQYTPQQFQTMMAALQKDAVCNKEFEHFKQQLAAKQDGDLPKITRDEVKKIRIHQIELEREFGLKQQDMAAPNQQIMQQLIMLERTKMMDELYIAHNVKI